MRILNRLSPVQAVALAAVVSLSILGAAGCSHDDSSQTPTTAAASHNAPTSIPPPPNAPAKTPNSSNTPATMPAPGNATGQ